MAHKKAGGSSRNGRDSQSKRLGVKVYAASASTRDRSSCASAARACIQAPTSASGATTRFTRAVSGQVQYAVRGADNNNTVSVVKETLRRSRSRHNESPIEAVRAFYF